MSKPTALILGGISTGKAPALLSHIKDKCTIRLCDKFLCIPAADAYLTFLSPETKQLLKIGAADATIEYMQANLAVEASLKKVFTPKNGENFDYVFDLTGEEDYSAHELQHIEKTAKLVAQLGRVAASYNVKAYVRQTSYAVATTSSSAKKGEALREDDASFQPYSVLSKWDLEAARALANIPELNLVLVRSAMIYGPWIINEFTGRLLIAEIYKYTGEQMDSLWSKELKHHTVHSEDFAAAFWSLAEWMASKGRAQAESITASSLPPCRPLADGAKWYSSDSYKSGDLDKQDIEGLCPRTKTVKAPLFNLVDEGDTDAGMLSSLVADSVGVKAGFTNVVINQFAKMNLDTVQQEFTDSMMEEWPSLVAKSSPPILQPIFDPKIPRELLSKHSNALDGSNLKKHLPEFKLSHPSITKAEVDKLVKSWRGTAGVWPNAPPKKK